MNFLLQYGRKKIEHESLRSRNSDEEDNESIVEDVDNDDNSDDIQPHSRSDSVDSYRDFDNEDSLTHLSEYEHSFDDLKNYQQKNFHLSDIYEFVTLGVQAIVDDEVTKRFDTEGKFFYKNFLFLSNFSCFFLHRTGVMELVDTHE